MSFKSEIFETVDAIPESYWESLGCTRNIYYSPEFLKAFEIANTDIDFNYIFILKNGKAVAFGNTQIVTIGVETITKNTRLLPWIKRFFNWLFCNSKVRILFCGNVFLSGEYGTFLKTGEPKIETFEALAQSIRQLKCKKRMNAIFVKDFINESLYITEHLKTFGYVPMHVEPNMVVSLKPEWKSFTDYLNALKSKYRVKANRADAKSEPLEAKFFTEDDIESYKDELQKLYQNTIDNADFNAQILNLDTYIHLKNTFKDKFIVKGYFLNNVLVGFLSAMQNGTNLDAHFIGLDYTKNREFSIYPRILNDYIRLGLQTKSKQINLGRTASEIKSTIGAEPLQLTCYIRHKHYLPNQILKPIIQRSGAAIKRFKQHQPFK
ncbi:hypothetical protein [Winogradskyella ouciana]|uniref:hypothetical protein n=1 Tax=Winogradskyella ouciana TaxID=2608631 RepID=UPI003D2CD881